MGMREPVTEVLALGKHILFHVGDMYLLLEPCLFRPTPETTENRNEEMSNAARVRILLCTQLLRSAKVHSLARYAVMVLIDAPVNGRAGLHVTQ
jgi:hypothetical protein